MQIEFVNPHYLWALFSLIPLALILKQFEDLRIRRCKMISNPNSYYDVNFNKLSLTPLLVAGLLILTLARPFIGSETIELPGISKDILVLQDISKSMLANDVKPNRLDLAKRKLEDILKYSAQSDKENRIGLVLFSGESYLYCPLTEDYGVLQHFIKSISTDLITSQGTAISDALSTAVKSLEEVKAKAPSVVIITDGEDNTLEVNKVIAIAQSAGLKVNILAVGTPEGSPIPESSGGFLKDRQGNIVISKLADKKLQEIAEKTGGIYRVASVSNADIAAIINDGSKGYLNTGKKNFTIYNEQAHFLLLGILAVTLIFVFFRKESLIFSLAFLLVLHGVAEAEDLPKLSLNEAYHAYQMKDFDSALSSFEYYYKLSPEEPKIAQSYASTLYNLGKFKEAKEIFEKIAASAETGKQKFDALYNLGNSNFKLEDYKSAISDYEQALKIKPQDPNASNNLALSKIRLAQAKPTPTPTPKPSPSQDKKDEDKKKEEQDQQDEKQDQKQEEQQKQDQEQQDKEQEDKKDQGEQEDSQEKEDESEEEKKDGDKQENEDSKAENSDQKEEEQANEEKEDVKENSEGEAKPMDEKQLKEAEAKAWLESLEDTPLLLRRKTSRTPNRNTQQW